jgi:hypothetical protein
VEGGGFLPADSKNFIVAIPNEGYIFSSRNDGNIENTREIKLTQNMLLKAIFETSLTTNIELTKLLRCKFL